MGKPSASLGMSISDLWHGMESRKSHVSELKNWMHMHSKKKKKKMHMHTVSPTGVMLLAFFIELFKVSKTTIKFLTCSKLVK